MVSKTLNTRIALKIDTAAAWSTSTLVLMKGEVAIESDTRKFKIGDGAKTFANLEYAAQLPNIVKASAPTSEDTGYEVGQMWVNSTNGVTYVLQTNDPQPVWVRLAKYSDITDGNFGDMHATDYDTNGDKSVDKADSLKSGDKFVTVDDSADTDTVLWTGSKIKSSIETAVEPLAKAEDVYTKTQVDDALELKADKTELDNYVPTSQVGKENGVASLGADGKIPSAQLPSYVDDILEFANLEAFPEADNAETGKIYVALDTNKTYRWGGTSYVEISASLAIGTTEGTAFDGKRGKDLEDKVAGIETSVGELGALAHEDTVSTDFIDDAAVTEAKLAADAVVTAKIKDAAVTDAKIDSMNALKLTQAEGDYLIFNCGNATA